MADLDSIQRIEIEFFNEGVHDVTYYFRESGTEPFSSTEFRSGTPTAIAMDAFEVKLKNLLAELRGK